MLASITSFLTTLAMLAHSVGGCCWHHPHSQTCDAAGHETHTAGTAQQDHLCEHSHGHGALAEDSPSESDDHQHHVACDEGKCQYLKATAPAIDLLCSVWAAVLPADAESYEALSSIGSHAPVVDVRPLSAPSVRAMTQAWLL